MKRFIVTTTIYEPSEATMKYAARKDWNFIIVGDLKTPHQKYRELENVFPNVQYLSPEWQEKNYPELSDAIGWNCVMRRNIGFVEAYRLGADIVATIDDDNIPYDNWGKNVWVGQEKDVTRVWHDNTDIAFDIMKYTNHPELWHRGFPLDLIPDSRNNSKYANDTVRMKVLFQADLWDGDPDIDAVCRKIYNPKSLKLQLRYPGVLTSKYYAAFNSQNTFIAREALPYYMVFPHVGRMDDIWGGYIAQYLLNTRPVFMSPTVYQDRNAQDVNKNLRDEILGYTKTYELLNDIENWHQYLPAQTVRAFNIYRRQYE